MLASEAAESVVAKVRYSVITTLDGEMIEQEWLVVQRPPDTRFETSIVRGGEEFRTIVINTGGKSYVCFSFGGEDSCLVTDVEQSDENTAALDLFFDVLRTVAEEPEEVDLVDRSERQIAGVDATCFMVESTLVGLGDGEICLSDEGILLLLHSQTDGRSSTFEATFVGEPTDADFELPYDIVDLPDLDILP